MHVGNRPRGEPVEGLPAAVARVHTVRQPSRVKLPASIDRGSVSRASTRMDVGSRPRGEPVEVLPAAVARVHTDRQPPREASRRHRPGERVESLDQDARRQPRRVVSLSRSCPRPSPGSTPIGNRRVSIDQGSVSRASTRMHVGSPAAW